MRAIFNSKEREVQDWKELIGEADSRFKIRAFANTPGAKLGIIDIEWTG